MNRTITSLCVLAATVVVSTQVASAQMSPMFSVGGEYLQSLDTDFKGDSDNAVSIQTASVDLQYVQPVGRSSSLIFGLSTGRTEYDFDQEMPWEKVNDLGATVIYTHELGGKWSLLGMGLVRSSYSTEADIEDGFTWGALLGAKYQKSETFSYTMGLAYITRLEDSDLLVPIVGFEWQINDRLYLDGMMGLSLKYDITGEGNSVFEFGLDYSMEDFRLQKDVVDATQAAVQPNGFGCVLSYTQRFSDNLSLILKVRGLAEQEFKTMLDGHKVSSFKTDPTLLYGVGINLTF